MIRGSHGILIRRARCPHCSSRATRVYRSLAAESGTRVQYRICQLCELRFKTVVSVTTSEPPRRPRI